MQLMYIQISGAMKQCDFVLVLDYSNVFCCVTLSTCHCNARRHTIKIYFCNFFGMFDIFNLDLKLINILMPINHPYHN
jgi:hypothetical protein